MESNVIYVYIQLSLFFIGGWEGLYRKLAN